MKKTISAITNWLGKYALAGFFCILVALDVSFRFFYRDCTGVSTLRMQPLIFTIGWALLFCGLVSLLPTLGKRIAMIFIVSVQAILCIVHGVMYNLFGSFSRSRIWPTPGMVQNSSAFLICASVRVR